MLNTLSLGAGVQSTTMALMAAHGEIEPMPDCAIFADTGDEPQAVYDHLKWLMSDNVLPFPVHIVSKPGPSLSEKSLQRGTSKKTGRQYVSLEVPVWLKQPNGDVVPGGRSCTRDFKINPINRKIKELCGIVGRLPKEPVARSWIGISTDEAHRMKPSRLAYIETHYPLIDKRMSRRDCLRWMESRNYPTPPRSACTYCPYHSNAEWLRIKREEPDTWSAAVDYEKRMKATVEEWDEALRGEPFLWQGGKTLEEADFGVDDRQWDLFGNECEGMCGV